ncbi:MAG: M3 family metallopeptidase, partial [Pseudomonadota bacterium]
RGGVAHADGTGHTDLFKDCRLQLHRVGGCGAIVKAEVDEGRGHIFHDGPAPADPMQLQAAILEEIGMPRAIRMRHATPHFAHVFAGDGYSSGYYSYMWSEVMDADAFAAFEEAGGPFDADTAKRLEATVLSSGGSVDAAELYTAFRGRLPGVEALLKGRGLDKAA